MSLDVKLCLPKITTLYNSWKTERSKFENSDSLIFIRGKNQEEAGYSKSTSFQLWLFGYELPEMVAVFGEKSIVFLASSKKAAFLEPLKKAAADVSSDEKTKLPEIQVLTRSKGDQDAANFESIANMIKGSFDGKVVGLFTKEVATHTGPFAGSFIASLSKFQKVNAAAGTGIHMAIKDKQDLTSVRGAASLSSDILHKFLRRRITESVDDPDKSPTHSSLAESALAYFVPDAKDEKLKYINKHKLEVGDVDSCYTPIVQSGKKFSLKVSAQSDESILASSGAIMCTLGARYNFHCSNVGRTFIFDPSDEQRKNYEMLISCYEEAIPTMRPGKKLSATLDKVKAILKEKKRSDLEVHLPKSLGFCMTYEFRESALAISAKCSERYAENMVFNLAIGFENLPFKGDKSKPYALQIVDTVLITSEDPEVLTTNPKKWDDIAWDLQGDDEEDKEIEEDDSKARLAAELLKTDKFTGGRRSAKVAQDDSNEARKAKQKELEAKVNEAAKRRLLNQVDEKTNSQLKKTVACFKNRKDMNSEESRKLKIWIDKTAHAVVLPVFGMPVPFHISTIKSCNLSDDEPRSFLKIVFDTPKPKSSEAKSGLVYLKELTFRSEHMSGINKAGQMIKNLQKNYKTLLEDKAQRENFVQQEELIKNPKGVSTPELRNIFARPSTDKRRTGGTLEAHKNGFLWKSSKGDSIKILYNRVRFAFYQPPDNDIVILLHFHLKSGIMIGKKQHKDVQFFMEVGEVASDLSKRQTAFDRDELEQEHQERLKRKKQKKNFQVFIDKVQSLSGNIEFEVPQADLGFNGVPGKETVLCMPTTNCLVALTQIPPYVLALDDVERVSFERVNFALRNFDLCFIFKDYDRKVEIVTAIERKSLEDIKEWLTDNLDIPFHESARNLNWAVIMKQIVSDPEEFIKEGGWNFLNYEEGSEEEDSDESEEYQASSDDQESESEDDMSDSDESSDSGSGSGSDDLGSDESEGMDWDELEKKAERDDRESSRRTMEDDDTSARKRGGGGGGGQAKRKPTSGGGGGGGRRGSAPSKKQRR